MVGWKQIWENWHLKTNRTLEKSQSKLCVGKNLKTHLQNCWNFHRDYSTQVNTSTITHTSREHKTHNRLREKKAPSGKISLYSWLKHTFRLWTLGFWELSTSFQALNSHQSSLMPLPMLPFQLIMLCCVYFQWVVNEWMNDRMKSRISFTKPNSYYIKLAQLQ